MKTLALAVVAGLVAFGGQSAVAAPADARDEAGTRSSCNAQWSAMVAARTTGGLSRYEFMDRCLGHPPVEHGFPGLVLLGAAAAGLGAVLATQHNDHPASP